MQHWTRFVLVATAALAACSAPPPSTFGGGKSGDPNDPNGGGGTFGSGNTPGSNGNNGTTTLDNGSPCDDGITGNGAEDVAKAMGLCKNLVSAKFTRGFGRDDAPKAEQAGVLEKFGNVIRPREGKKLVVLSSGYAGEQDGPGGSFGGDSQLGPNGVDWWNAVQGHGNGTAPPGFPKPATGCPIDTNVNDLINLRLQIKAPDGATGFKFDFNFYSGEWPGYVCSMFNDGFVAFLSSKDTKDNISFDKNKNPVSVNNGFFDRCTPGVTTGCESLGGATKVSQCPGGAGELAGTGFGVVDAWCPNSPATSTNGGATGWLTSQAPIQGGETFTLELMIWDTGDGVLDSSVLLDNFQWIGGGPVTTGTDRPN
jgi:hypothetical protein